MSSTWFRQLSRMVRWNRNSQDPPPQNLNVVWICADDFTPSMCGAYGNTIVRTPNLDRLAAGGIRFDRAFCTCPLSTPSRQSFWTGRFPRSIGVTLSPTPLPNDEVTLPTMLREAGYEVAAFGKTHFYAPRPHEFDVCFDWSQWQEWQATLRRTPSAELGEVLGTWRPFRDPAAVWLNSAVLPYPAFDDEMFGTFLAREAAAYLGRPKGRPFFLYVSFYETHSPFWFPVEYRNRHAPSEFTAPLMTPGCYRRLPAAFRGLSAEQKCGIMAAYATSAEYLDKNVGLVLDGIERAGLAGRTLVIFTSDHGYLLGQHGRFEKHCCFEPAIRAALLMRLPQVIAPGRATDALVQLIDLVPTILELCGAPVPKNLHGRSMTQLVRGKSRVHRDRIFVEYSDNDEAMIRTDRWKLIYSTGTRRRRDGYALDSPTERPSTQLFDLATDPDELVNLAHAPAHASRVTQFLGELADHLADTARFPKLIPKSRNVRELLQACLGPRDEGSDYW